MSSGDKKSSGNLASEHLALCPLDGRYSQIGAKLAPYFSEFALVKNRVKVEAYWLAFMLQKLKSSEVLSRFDKQLIQDVWDIYERFTESDFLRVKEIEAVTNHDVKSVELFVAEKLREVELDYLVSFVHFGCTSEDITNTAYATMIKTALAEVWLPAAYKLVAKLLCMAAEEIETPMLAHTHGQPATPTTVGKELAVYVARMRRALQRVKSIAPLAKFNGATGNYSAISTAFPKEDWPKMASAFMSNYMSLNFNPITTQIESHDYICNIADAIRNFNNILLDFDVDMWLYISKKYFKQIAVKTEVGSSTMPHKVNPIRFENSEANIDMSNAIFMALSNKLPRSRMQRDLSDSSTQRNIGLAFGYSLQAIEQTLGGLKKVVVNKVQTAKDLNFAWEVLAEPIQTMLRKYGIPNAYDQLKEMTRGKNISRDSIRKFIETLDVLSPEDKQILLELTPSKYIGLAVEITKEEIATCIRIPELSDQCVHLRTL